MFLQLKNTKGTTPNRLEILSVFRMEEDIKEILELWVDHLPSPHIMINTEKKEAYFCGGFNYKFKPRLKKAEIGEFLKDFNITKLDPESFKETFDIVYNTVYLSGHFVDER